jgi:hypothetical protein
MKEEKKRKALFFPRRTGPEKKKKKKKNPRYRLRRRRRPSISPFHTHSLTHCTTTTTALLLIESLLVALNLYVPGVVGATNVTCPFASEVCPLNEAPAIGVPEPLSPS